MMRPSRTAAPLMAALILAMICGALWEWSTPSSSVAVGPGSSQPTARPAPAVRNWHLPNPQYRMLLGAYTSLPGQPQTEAAVEQRERAMGRRYDLELTYYNWHDLFPMFGEDSMASYGRTPVMAWSGPGQNPVNFQTLAEVNNGRDDAWILRQAEAIKKFGEPIYLRLMPEMNGDWYKGFAGGPAGFIFAWRHIYRLFVQAGVHNVIWAWCPNVSPGNWASFYPGNAYVNVIGVDGFSWRTRRRGPSSFQQVFDAFLRHYAGRKPLMVDETGTTNPRDAASFINGMHTYLRDVAGPRYGMFALCWLDTGYANGIDWRVDQTPAAWKAWLALARAPYFGGHDPG
jgi:hypothetical protein